MASKKKTQDADKRKVSLSITDQLVERVRQAVQRDRQPLELLQAHLANAKSDEQRAYYERSIAREGTPFEPTAEQIDQLRYVARFLSDATWTNHASEWNKITRAYVAILDIEGIQAKRKQVVTYVGRIIRAWREAYSPNNRLAKEDKQWARELRQAAKEDATRAAEYIKAAEHFENEDYSDGWTRTVENLRTGLARIDPAFSKLNLAELQQYLEKAPVNLKGGRGQYSEIGMAALISRKVNAFGDQRRTTKAVNETYRKATYST